MLARLRGTVQGRGDFQFAEGYLTFVEQRRTTPGRLTARRVFWAMRLCCRVSGRLER